MAAKRNKMAGSRNSWRLVLHLDAYFFNVTIHRRQQLGDFHMEGLELWKSGTYIFKDPLTDFFDEFASDSHFFFADLEDRAVIHGLGKIVGFCRFRKVHGHVNIYDVIASYFRFFFKAAVIGVEFNSFNVYVIHHDYFPKSSPS
ncbi:MAG: hypothetical protein K0S12_1576 [Bacteroidetes bacterium]|nr:hypothetical protein [Bacteroidota bacterium]